MRAPSRSIPACRKATASCRPAPRSASTRLCRKGIPREHYERITYAYADRATIDDYVNGKADAAGEAGDEQAVAALAQKILAVIGKEPLYYTDIAERFSTHDFRTVARALGHLHATEKLWQDPRGKMCVRGSEFAAKPPRR